MSKRVSLILRDADEAMIAPFLHGGQTCQGRQVPHGRMGFRTVFAAHSSASAG